MTRLFISYLGQFPCFITLCLTFYCATASAVITADTLNIRESATQDALDGHIEYYYEKEASADSPVDLGSVTRASFKPLEGITINPGQVPYPVWLRFSLENPLSDAVSRYLVIGFGYIPYVDVYYRDPDGNWQRQVSGKAVDYENRAIPHPHYPFELKVPPGTTDYYVRLSSHAPMVAPSYLMTPDRFSDYSIQIYVFGALYFGFTLAIFLYKLFLFFFLRDRLYLYFILFIGFSCLAQLYLMGLLDGFVSHAPLLKLGGGDIFTQTAVLFALTFIRRLFGSYKSQENFDRFYHWLAIVTFIIWLMAIFRVPNIHFAVVAEVSLFSLVVLYHALKIWREGYTPAGYFFLGWLVFTFGAIITSLIYSAVIPFTILTVFVYPVCSSFQALFLSFSLANRIRILQNEAQNKEILLQRAEAKTEAKSQFFAQMSHEIRTPMNGVLGMAQLLRETPLTQNQRSLTDILFSSGKNLLNIINDILDFSKLEAGKLRIEKTGFNLEQELNEIASNFTLNALEKELEFSIHYPVDLPRELEGDPTRLRQILINLLGNAFKFTTIGSVKCLISG
ncbi:MAG: 7TM diverse intracellular signaling domain-containing protein, partial [Ketobacteraceae bacterium]|nr:7TM diverse intracellular signaling domain-containing protein [Ketobacteraceae bacterium]